MMSKLIEQKQLSKKRLPNHRWQIYSENPHLARELAKTTNLPPVLAQVLINRGIETPEGAEEFINPDSLVLPPPIAEFPDLAKSVDLLHCSIASGQKIAICGDYDADGMTSTALLLRALRSLGARVDYAIPSRMKDGYGINVRIVEEFYQEGVSLILTVDNGISAVEPVKRARELGLDVIVTDHHEVPKEIPPATAILNPKLIREESPYRGVAGVGVAYILAVSLAQAMGKAQPLIKPMRELLTLGTIADLAPLTGVNRRWVKWGLRQLPKSELAGIQALIQVSGADGNGAGSKAMKPDEIGFRLGPRINAIGRIGDPQIIIELLTTDDMAVALERAMQCEAINQTRQQMCQDIEFEAIALIEEQQIDLKRDRVLVLLQPAWCEKPLWHHGVIGIVASRLVERYGVPVFICTYEDSERKQVRGSARGIPEFDVFEALQFCHNLLHKYGGHRAAGGFSLAAKLVPDFHACLRMFANRCLDLNHLKPLIEIDSRLDFEQINLDLYRQIDALEPCGIENPAPVFWTPNVQVLEQRIVGKGHIKLTLTTEQSYGEMKAIAWRWGDYFPLPPVVDVAYKLKENTWNGQTNVEIELISVRCREADPSRQSPQELTPFTTESPSLPKGATSAPYSLKILDPKPPSVGIQPSWLTGQVIEHLLPKLQGKILWYGANKPEIPPEVIAASGNRCQIICDRPTEICESFLFWTLPPSGSHLLWLLAKGKPCYVYIYNHVPQLPTADQLRSRLQAYIQEFPHEPLNLLQIGQRWWVAPSTLIATLRELGHPCPDFAKTGSLEQELERLRRWYRFTPAKLAQIAW
ncbi:single-stranded-DNA-specific exonuclease RecJ [Planktothricoides sp. FACHB-1370]|uniref:Single-stranded-DNA-specific exonuclease RecJ n=2 Tax=Planktothricoides raciborskii TaxID=132608 RepID=A0AAU8JB37_9CYAN|nr:single-stranded-DNA-specific exonuclease RecJ [Planktothricoides raciborskii]KOR38596.1 single-stranded DNA exonuclease [Planktothricoides sp. SR001]MBD2546642.1 single-stranded-DNA-specific exonuclease RecJ [Planktothricoides raciborskii FACHB-1370]MBD2585177.1 single-stranded-DNA-specific exonuclease RecJ [Planktothricoides raciborskii FACHB-1261]